MNTYTESHVKAHIITSIREGYADVQDDGNGQLVIYTGIFHWADGTFHDEPDPKCDKNRDDEDEPPPRCTECHKLVFIGNHGQCLEAKYARETNE